jgi:hypothetical protein
MPLIVNFYFETLLITNLTNKTKVWQKELLLPIKLVFISNITHIFKNIINTRYTVPYFMYLMLHRIIFATYNIGYHHYANDSASEYFSASASI